MIQELQRLVHRLLASAHLDDRTALLVLVGLFLAILIVRTRLLHRCWHMMRRWWSRRRLPRPLSSAGRAGYVYIIRARDDGLYKIGLTVDPAQRLATFQTARPDLQYEHLIRCRDRYDAERRLHERYARKRRAGEWFALDQGDIETLKRIRTL
jgi:hypothetical protein